VAVKALAFIWKLVWMDFLIHTTSEELGKACAFRCSSDAGFIVGQNLLVDGGSVNVTM